MNAGKRWYLAKLPVPGILLTDSYDVALYNVPGEKAYAKSDLFEPHPTKPSLWKM